MSDIFLWPRHRPVTLRLWLGGGVTAGDIERQVQALYPDAHPVLFSSARAGLRATLLHLGLSRPDLVWCPPFSSHCVFDAVSRIATPTTQAAETPAAALIYHPWGFVCQPHWPAETTLIEDAVDTLLAPGTSPFAVGGRFALWSLPKVVASAWGGIVFCRQAEDAEALRRQRDQGPGGTLQALLRLREQSPQLSAYWHGAESGHSRLPAVALRHIAAALDTLPDEVAARRTRMAPLLSFSLTPLMDHARLPSNLPLHPPVRPEPVEGHSQALNGPQEASTSSARTVRGNPPRPSLTNTLPSGDRLTAGIRSFNTALTAPTGHYQRVLPFPIHQDIRGTDIAEIASRLASERDSSINEPDIV